MNSLNAFLIFTSIFHSCLTQAKSSSYEGKMIDAVTQWPSTYQLKQLSQKIKSANVTSAGISINDFKPKADYVLTSSIAIDNEPIFYKGSPKYSHFASHLTEVKIDSVIKEIKEMKYRFVSEIMYRHADKKEGLVTKEGERAIDPLSKESLLLLEKLKAHYPDLPIFVHWEFYKWEEDYKRFGEFFNKFSKQKFIINHLGFGNASQVKWLLEKHPNIFFTISKKNVKFDYFRNIKLTQGPPLREKSGNINQEWLKLFNEYPDRFLFATDSHKHYMWNNYEKTVKDYRSILGQLTEETAEKIAFKNAEKLFSL